MTAFTGMDVEAVRSIANGLTLRSQELTAVIGAVDGLVSQLASVWAGPDAHQFASWWQQEHRPRLVAAGEAVNGLGRSASNNASEQEQASGGAAGSAAAPGRVGGGAADVIGRALHGEDTGFGLIDKGYLLAHHMFGYTSPFFENVGKVGSGLGVATGLWDAGQALDRQDYGSAAHSTVDAIGSGLGFAGPVGELGGFTAKLWADAAEQYTKVDWTDWDGGFPNPLNGDDLRDVWVPAMSETFGELGRIVWDDL